MQDLEQEIRQEFRDQDEQSTKVGVLRTIEQGNLTCEEHMQKFKKMAQGSRYTGRALIEEFKRSLNGGIRRRLMEAEEPPEMIGEWYERATRTDQNWRQIKAEERFYGRERKEPPKLVVKLPFTPQQSLPQQQPQQPQQCPVQSRPKPFTPQ